MINSSKVRQIIIIYYYLNGTYCAHFQALLFSDPFRAATRTYMQSMLCRSVYCCITSLYFPHPAKTTELFLFLHYNIKKNSRKKTSTWIRNNFKQINKVEMQKNAFEHSFSLIEKVFFIQSNFFDRSNLICIWAILWEGQLCLY